MARLQRDEAHRPCRIGLTPRLRRAITSTPKCRRCSSVVEQRIRNARVVGSIPTTGLLNYKDFAPTELAPGRTLDATSNTPRRVTQSAICHLS
jgi:hypothetical protein